MADKAVVFIVEGLSDKKALENIFKKIYRHKEMTFLFTRGDLTSDEDMDEKKIEDEIYKHVEAYKKDKKLKTSDIWQIVHLFDTDGTFITDKNIIKGETKEFYYTTENIMCSDIERVKTRNKHKCELMNYLLDINEIKKIPYKCYYMSSNLDHALYNKLNMTDDEKVLHANAFYEMFMDKEKLFIKFLEKDVVNGVPNSFPASWRYIKEECHSLERHTNLNLYFIDNPLFD